MNQRDATKVLLGPSSFASTDQTPLNMLREAGCEIIDNPYKRKLTKEELLDLLGDDVIGLIAGLEPLDRDVLKKTKLKVISRVGSGLSNVDMEAAKELGIEVRYTPYGPTAAVAELTVGVLLNMLRMVPQMDRALHEGRWKKRIGFQLEGKTVLIIGFGRIGRRLAELLTAFNVEILVVDPFLKNPAAEKYPVIPLDEAVPKADIITIHCSGDECLLTDDLLSLVKPGVFLLNAARGGLISETTLIKGLDQGVIGGVWLDTFECEPYDGPLKSYEQVILTPHIGSYTKECRKQMETEAVQNLLEVLSKNEN